MVGMAKVLYSEGYAILEPTADELALTKQQEDEQRRQRQLDEEARRENDPAVKAAREQKAREDAAAAEKALFTEWSKPLPGENSLQTLQRVVRLKDAYWRSRFPRAVPSTEVHPDTIRNSNQELKLVAERAVRQSLARNTPPISPRTKD